MINFIVTFYKVIFNYLVKSKYHNSPSFMAKLALVVFMFFVFMNFTTIISIIFHTKTFFDDLSRVQIKLTAAVTLLICYLIIFYVVKFNKAQFASDEHFIVSKFETRRVYSICAVNFILFFTLGILRKYYFHVI